MSIQFSILAPSTIKQIIPHFAENNPFVQEDKLCWRILLVFLAWLSTKLRVIHLVVFALLIKTNERYY